MRRLMATFLLLLLLTPVLRAQNAAKAGMFVVEPPTLICLGFEWEITGDENRNATVEVSYRPARATSTAWKEAMPLLRMGGEKIFRAPYTVPRPVRRQHPRPRAGHRVRGAADDEGSGRRDRTGRADDEGPHARGAESGDRRTRAARLSAELARRESRSRTSPG